MVLRRWAREYLCKRFVINASDSIVDEVFARYPASFGEMQDYEVTLDQKELLVSSLRELARRHLEQNEPEAWYRSFFSEKPGGQT